MAKKKSGNVLGFVLLAVILVALVLVVVGMFVGQVGLSYVTGLKGETTTETFKLFGEWGDRTVGPLTLKGVSNVFAVISFIVTLIGLVLLLIDGIVHYVLDKNMKIIRFIGVAASLVGAILILVSGLVMANQCYGGEDGKKLLETFKVTFSAGAGVWLGFVGGLLGAVGGGLGLLKKFN